MEDARNLYQKLSILHREVHGGLVTALSSPVVSPQAYFMGKGILQKNYRGLADDIAGYLRDKGMDISDEFKDKLFFSFLSRNRRPARQALLDIEYGRIWADKFPDEVFQAFNDERLAAWIITYLLPGIWLGKNAGYVGNQLTKKRLEAWRTPELIGWLMQKGISKLNKYEGVLGKKLPHRKDIGDIADYLVNPNRDQLELELTQASLDR